MFSERFKQLREEKGLTQQELSEALDVKRSTIAMYESTNSNPELKNLLKIADYFEVSIDYLTGRSDRDKDPVFSAPGLEEMFKLNPLKPLWIRIENPSPFSENLDRYALGEGQTLQLYDPFEARKDDGRIYLRFLNCQENSYEQSVKNIYEFLKKYGFLGRTSLDDKSIEVKLLDDAVNRWRYRLKNQIVNGAYYFPDEINYFSYSDNFTHSELNEYVRLGIADFSFNEMNRFYINPNIDLDGKGYYEEMHSILFDMEPMKEIVTALSYNDMEYAIESINKYTGDIHIHHVLHNGRVRQTFTYTSLLSLMYFELLFDVKNNIIPIRCRTCKKYFLPDAREQKTCPECNSYKQQKRQPKEEE